MFDYQTMPTYEMICVDMKSFYASCSCVLLGLDPLTTYLAVVGSRHHPGSVVLAATPLMKQTFGIKTGSRLFEIPTDTRIILVEPQMKTYLQISHEISQIFYGFAARKDIYTYSVDESFINITGSGGLLGTSEEVATQIKTTIFEQFGLTCCIGIGPNMLLSKVCLDVEAKKIGIARWTYADVKTKLWAISPLREMWGIGAQTEKHLNQLGIHSIGELANYNLDKLIQKFGVMGRQLHQHAWGVDFSKMGETVQPRNHGVGKGQTLTRDYDDLEEIKILILEMCEDVAKRLRSQNLVTKTVSLSLRYSKKVIDKKFSRSKTVEAATNDTMTIYTTCLQLLMKHYQIGTPIRQIQIRLEKTSLNLGDIQLDLFQPNNYKRQEIGYVMDAIRNRYGSASLLRAVSATKEATAKQRSTLIGGHKA